MGSTVNNAMGEACYRRLVVIMVVCAVSHLCFADEQLTNLNVEQDDDLAISRGGRLTAAASSSHQRGKLEARKGKNKTPAALSAPAKDLTMPEYYDHVAPSLDECSPLLKNSEFQGWLNKSATELTNLAMLKSFQKQVTGKLLEKSVAAGRNGKDCSTRKCKLPKCPTMEETRKSIASLGQKKCNEKVTALVFGSLPLLQLPLSVQDDIKDCARYLLKQANYREFTALSVTSKQIGQWSCEELHLGSESGFVCMKEDKINAKKPKQTICKGLIVSTKTTACRSSFKDPVKDRLSWKNSYTTQTKLMPRPLTKQIACNGNQCRVSKVLACRGPECPQCSKRCVSTLKHF